MDEEFFRDGEPRGHDNLFAWTVFILLLIGFAFACWLGTFYIFGHPENPRSYKILKRLKKIDAPKRFEVTAAPVGKFRTAKQLYDEYITYTRLQLDHENQELVRNYINNYQATKFVVPYVTGRFTILDAYELKKSDMFQSGVVALAQSADFPNVLIEYVYTSPPQTVPLLDQMLQTGLDIRLERTLDVSAVIHVTKIYDGRLQLTVVPLLYGTYALKQATGSFSLEPPPDLNMEGGVPIVKAGMLQDAFRAYADYKKSRTPGRAGTRIAASGSATPTPANTELVRIETPTPSPTPGLALAAAPSSPAPTPPLVAQESPTPTPAAEMSTPAVVAMNATPAPLPVPVETPIAVETPPPAFQTPPAVPLATPTAPPVSPEGVKLQPFLVSAPTPNTTTSGGGAWRTFAPGQMPRGRIVDPPEINDLANRGLGGERLYLRGNFIVTASGESRAVLRIHNSIAANLIPFVRSNNSPRIIVEYPAGSIPPTEGTNFVRDESRPFQVTDVRRGADGQVNVYVREITTSP